MINAYINFHKAGFAHSLEVWQDKKLVGGLYGVSINSVFFGESMFNYVTDASKAAFYFLIQHLKKRKFTLLDSQFSNDFTLQLGAIEIPNEEYLQRLEKALNIERTFVD